jgi:hypothetical protein
VGKIFCGFDPLPSSFSWQALALAGCQQRAFQEANLGERSSMLFAQLRIQDFFTLKTG